VRWLHLFSDSPPDIKYKQLIFIGKDSQESLRERWKGLSREQLIFIEMYPGSGNSVERGVWSVEKSGKQGPQSAIHHQLSANAIHVEDYQLAQLKHYGVEAVKKVIEAKPSSRVILYPEKGFSKRKWPPENFAELYGALKQKGFIVHILEPLGLKLNVEEKIFFEELTEVRDYFQNGGIFVSNDSGMAHLAGQCGLLTITIFTDFDPHVWHPRGRNISLECIEYPIDVRSVEALITQTLETDQQTRSNVSARLPQDR
jgi:hypothetical protein